MNRLTISVTDEQYTFIEEHVADSEQFDSKSEVVRHVFDEYKRLHNELTTLQEEHKKELDRLQAEIEECNQTIQRLENEKRTLINSREEHTELVRYVEKERELQRRDEQREDAPVWRRAKWWVFGRSENRETE